METIANELVHHIKYLDLENLTALWGHLSEKIFVHLTKDYSSSLVTVQSTLHKAYLTNCIQLGRKERVSEFFAQKYVDLSAPDSEWSKWLGTSLSLFFDVCVVIVALPFGQMGWP